ncbi:MAG: bifunctional uridylyltransferase/uridylyl-removing enzyme [Bryobacteraceae bacterium]|nr:MAG: bifunctional uridylyltransferase/uridylyl-removing enzyme [Bryobacteraceae bacterium]
MTTAAWMPSEPAATLLEERTWSVDALAREAFARHLEAPGAALLAVGGYGRRRLFPHSDIDLLLLSARPLATIRERDRAGEFLRKLWDAGLRASHSVRTVEECCSLQPGNPELTFSLLDHRFLAGDGGLFREFGSRWRRFLDSRKGEIARLLCTASRARHARFQQTVFHLEPDVKEGPGGLRDLQTAEWLAALMKRPAPPDRWLEPLAAVRIFLHLTHGRDNNVLDFDSQDAAARAGLLGARDPASFMRAWYRNAGAVMRAAERAMEEFESQDRSRLSVWFDRSSRLSTADLTVSRNLVFLRNPGQLERDPDLALRLFLFTARHGLLPSRETESRLEQHAARWTEQRADRPAGAKFWRELLSLPHAAAAVRAMRSTGHLAAALPEWRRIDHLVVPDFYHRFTVDEHTNVALEVLEELPREKTPPRRFFAELWEECGREQWLLRLALLLHDIGKGSGRDHAEESLSIARAFLMREGFAPQEQSGVLFLIGKHLLLSEAMQSRDVASEEVQQWLARELGSAERLRLLALLTYADISAVGAGRMTSWRAAQLFSLYRTLHARLESGLDEPASNGAALLDSLSPAARSLLAGLPARYRWGRTPEDFEQDAALLEKARAEGAAVRLSAADGAWQAVIAAADHARLFADLAGALSSFGMEIVQCEAFTHQEGFAVDAFRFADPHRTLELNPPEQERLMETLLRAALGRVSAAELLRRRAAPRLPARAAGMPPAITFFDDLSGHATVVEVVAQDRPALLHDLAAAISSEGCDIRLVLVDTRAHKAIDVFYVTRAGAPLGGEQREALRRALESACSAAPGRPR